MLLNSLFNFLNAPLGNIKKEGKLTLALRINILSSELLFAQAFTRKTVDVAGCNLV